MSDKVKELENAITALEAQRSVLGDRVVDPAIQAMRHQIQELRSEVIEPDKQRKIMTIVFVDVVGSTNLLVDLDPEDSMEIMDSSLQQLSIPINQYGGRVTRYMGDGFLATFGLPISRENDPEMAVMAGIGIIKEAERISQELKAKWKLNEFKVRIGINTGLVVTGGVTEAEDTLMGNAVNLAARMESSAPANGILISEYTYNHVRGLFEFKAGEKVIAKGFDNPVQVYNVIRSLPHSERTKGRGIEGIHTPLIGRNAELNLLRQCLTVTAENQDYHMVLISAEAGLGKSRLLSELHTWMDDTKYNATLFKVKGRFENRDTPFGIFRNLFSTYLNILENDDIDKVREKFREGFIEAHGLIEDLEERIDLVGSLVGYHFTDLTLENAKTSQELALRYIFQYLEIHAHQRHVLLTVDDLQWIDESSLDSLISLQENLKGSPITFILCSRPEIFERKPNWIEGVFDTVIQLNTLLNDESEKLIRNILHKVEYLPENIVERIGNQAAGNPYYIEEVIRMLISEGLILRDESKWYILEEKIDNVNVPATLTGVLQARLDSLSQEEREVLQKASVMGRVFWDQILLVIYGSEEGGIKVKDILKSLQEREFIFQRNTSAISIANEFMFTNNILREVTYESVLMNRRNEYHQQIANWLRSIPGDRMEENNSLIAYHLESAGNNEEAIDYYEKSATDARTKYALDQSYHFYERILNLHSKNDIQPKYQVLIKQEEILTLLGDSARRQDILVYLEEIADEAEDPSMILEVKILKAWHLWWLANYPQVGTILEEIMSYKDLLQDPEFSHKANYIGAWYNLTIGEIPKAIICANESLDSGMKTGQKAQIANSNNVLGLIYLAQGDFISSKNHILTFLKLSEEMNLLDRISTAMGNLAIPEIRIGNFEEAERLLTETKSNLEKRGDKSTMATILINLAWTNLNLGRWEDVLKFGGKGLELKRSMNHVEASAEGLLWLGHANVALGNYETARQQYEESLAKRLGMGQEGLIMGVYSALIRLSLKELKVEEAKGYNEKILEFISKGGTLDPTWEPLRICWVSYSFALEQGDNRAEAVKGYAYHLITRYLGYITDDSIKQRYLSSTFWRREWANVFDL
ncbi:MAG: adenylate/guanylate cyclase domain-containing protein [Candidatus Kariarchaeaceae archaeon]|jgi:class 3 adenylate cyclase/tetratricopeptide (TPR) repeat protein